MRKHASAHSARNRKTQTVCQNHRDTSAVDYGLHMGGRPTWRAEFSVDNTTSTMIGRFLKTKMSIVLGNFRNMCQKQTISSRAQLGHSE
ncbi:hypothetical protein CY34DRAFT_135839 [Suillus luteus UH-Slu-Lm8-n1]|uniref:Unplaced genomic scaffold CY34scaffold_103, whole genome shotgun sequence n=1 Tax=Suillus luteus UH-Slu-Lm8-n1 TaxID=930992 RepID=A0A0D0AL65_9AGAM|nr:hypothetical protein CY34DRAFT_135839 [Suillus luteus UH-Slu-Lm8-n1]